MLRWLSWGKGRRRNERNEWADEGVGAEIRCQIRKADDAPGCDAMETKRKRAHAHKAAARRQRRYGRREVHGGVEPTVLLSCSAGTGEAVRWLAVSVGQEACGGGMFVCVWAACFLVVLERARMGKDFQKESRRREEILGSTCFPLWQDRFLESKAGGVCPRKFQPALRCPPGTAACL